MTAPLARPRPSGITVAEYRRMGETGAFAPGERVELIEGEIVRMPPIGPLHSGLVNRLTRLLVRAVGNRAIVHVQNPVELSERSEPEPDLALLLFREDDYLDATPTPADTLLAIEVADSTLRFDRGTKVPLYARHGVPETWLIDARAERVTVHRDPGPDGYRLAVGPAVPGPLDVGALPGVRIDLGGLFRRG